MATPPQLNAASAVSALQEYQKLKTENKTAWIGLEVKNGKQCFKAEEVTIFTRLARFFGGGGWDFKKTTEALNQAFKDPSCQLDPAIEVEVRRNILGSASRWNESSNYDRITQVLGREMRCSLQIAKIEKYCKNFEITQNPTTMNMQIEYRFTSEKEREIVISKLYKEGVLPLPELKPKQTTEEDSFFVLKLSPTPSAKLLGLNSIGESSRMLIAIRNQRVPMKASVRQSQGLKSKFSAEEVKEKIFAAVPAAYGFKIIGRGEKLQIAYMFFASNANALSLNSGRKQLEKIETIHEFKADGCHCIAVDPAKIIGGKFENIRGGLEILQKQQDSAGGYYVK